MFLLLKGDLDNRLDPLFYSEDIFKFLKVTSFPVKKIREICTFAKSGFGAGKQDQNLEGKGIIQIRPTNMDENGLLKFDRNVYIPENYLETNNAYVLSKEDVLFNNTNSQEWVGKTAYFKEEGTFLHSNHVTVLQVDKNIIQPKYLWILLNIYQQKKIFYNICTNWNNQSGVGIDRLLSLKIPVPSLETQQIIINIFEKAYTIKKEKEAKVKSLLHSIDRYLLKEIEIFFPEKKDKTLKNRVFLRNINDVSGGRLDAVYYQDEYEEIEQQILTSKYGHTSLKNVITDLKNGVEIREYTETGFRYLRVTDLGKFDINNNSQRFVDVNEIPKKIKLNKDCILVSRSGSLGLVSVVEDTILNAILSSHIFKIELNTKIINPNYLEIFLRSILGQKQFFRKNSGGVIPELSQDALKTIIFPHPPLTIQESIVVEINQRRQQAKALENEAKEILEQAKAEVERMILGE